MYVTFFTSSLECLELLVVAILFLLPRDFRPLSELLEQASDAGQAGSSQCWGQMTPEILLQLTVEAQGIDLQVWGSQGSPGVNRKPFFPATQKRKDQFSPAVQFSSRTASIQGQSPLPPKVTRSTFTAYAASPLAEGSFGLGWSSSPQFSSRTLSPKAGVCKGSQHLHLFLITRILRCVWNPLQGLAELLG